jgi:hypothetical protein
MRQIDEMWLEDKNATPTANTGEKSIRRTIDAIGLAREAQPEVKTRRRLVQAGTRPYEIHLRGLIYRHLIPFELKLHPGHLSSSKCPGCVCFMWIY